MPRRSRALLGLPMLPFVVYGCAVYDTPSPAGSAGRAGDASGGGALNAGGSGEPAGGGAGAPSGGGDAGAASQPGGAAGDVGSAGAPDAVGGEGTLGGQGGGGNEAGAPPGCTTLAPEATCSCAVYETHEYWFCPTFLGFAAAEAKCSARGMHLPKVESQEEDAWLFATSTDRAMGEYYLGASDQEEPNTWLWLQGGTFWQGVADGTATGYTNFNANEPNASGDCLVVQSNGPWDDRICGDQRKYVCEATR